MELIKKYSKIKIGTDQIKHRIRYDDGFETSQGSVEARKRLFWILGTFVTTPELLACGNVNVCDKISITHIDSHWVIEGEAIETQENQ